MQLRNALAMLALVTLTALQAAHAQKTTPYEYDEMRERIKRFGTGNAPVYVWAIPGLDALNMPADRREVELQARIQRVVTELGNEVLPGGRKVNPAGGVILWVTEPGLEILQASGVPSRVLIGREWWYDTFLSRENGLDEIERRLRQSANGKVDVEITVDVPGVEFDIDRDTGEASQLLKTPEQQRAAVQSALALLTVLGVPMYPPPSTTPSGAITVLDISGVERNGTMVLRANEQGLAELAWEQRAIIAMRPVGYLPMRPAYIAAQPYGNPQAVGQTRVTLLLRRVYMTSTPASVAPYRISNQRLMDSVLDPYTVIGTPQWNSDFSYIQAVLSDADVESLLRSGDQRLQAISIEKPANKPTPAP